MPVVFERVSFSYDGSFNALENIDYEIKDGAFLGVVGHTGSGKSTFAQLINALIVPTQGRVLVDGIDTAVKKSRREIRSMVGLAFQYPETQLFANTVAEDIAFGPQNLGLSEKEIVRRVHTSLNKVGMSYEDFSQRSPFDLSGGQQRKVALAGILAMEPKVMVLDEPVAGMDPETVREIKAYLKELNTQGLTIILVSHSMEDVAELCSQVMVLDHGKLYTSGTPTELFSKQNAIELRRINLGVPQATEFALKLAERGLELKSTILNEQQLVNALIEKRKEA